MRIFLMDSDFLKIYVAKKDIRILTLKTKYNNCIYLEDRQSFIDIEKLEKAFLRYSKQG